MSEATTTSTRTDDLRAAEKQPFERHPKLASAVEAYATIPSLENWSDMLGEVNAVLASAASPPTDTTFPRGGGTGTYFRRLPNQSWVMLNHGDQWVTIPSPTWSNAPPAGTLGPMRPMSSAPHRTPIVAKHKPSDKMPNGWVGTITFGDDDEESADCLDQILHYNGDRLISNFHGLWDGWWPLEASPPAGTGDVEGLRDLLWKARVELAALDADASDPKFSEACHNPADAECLRSAWQALADAREMIGRSQVLQPTAPGGATGESTEEDPVEAAHAAGEATSKRLHEANAQHAPGSYLRISSEDLTAFIVEDAILAYARARTPPTPEGLDREAVAMRRDLRHYIDCSEDGLTRVPRQLLCRLENALRPTPTGDGDVNGITIERYGKDRQGATVRFAESEYDSEVFRIEEPLPGMVVVLDADGSILSVDIEDLKADMTPSDGDGDVERFGSEGDRTPMNEYQLRMTTKLALADNDRLEGVVSDLRAALVASKAQGGTEYGRATPLALVMREHFEEGHLSEEAKLLVAAALLRIWPDDRHTVETCDCERDPDLDADEPKCSECPTDAQWRAADAKLDAWLASRSSAPPPATNVGA